ncbi:MAG: hypothetical protein AAGF13_02850 [Pseudomonadota bacterium]
MTLNPFDPEGAVFWAVSFLLVGAIFACTGFFVGVNSLVFSQRALPVEITVVELVARDGQNSTLLAPVFEAPWEGEAIRYTSSAASLEPIHSAGDIVPGYLKASTGRIESDASLRAIRLFSLFMGVCGLGLGLFGIFLLRRRRNAA